MAVFVIALVTFHVLALAAVLMFARKDVILVDEFGRPIPTGSDTWQEQVVTHDGSMTITPQP